MARYLAAQLVGNRRVAVELIELEGLGGGITVADLHVHVIGAAQREIGRLWQENHITVAQEHLATAISQLALALLYRHLPRGAANGRRVVVACVQGEQHELGARIASDFLETAGFDVEFLGGNVPSESLASLVARRPPDLLCLAATMSFHVPALIDAVARARAAAPALPIAVGGAVLGWMPPARLDELGVATLGEDAHAIGPAARALLGVPAP